MNRPLSFFGEAPPPSAHAGSDMLGVQGNLIRPKIGGKRRQLGGFYPSVMGNFIGASSKYIVPMALFAGYKLMTKKAKTAKRKAKTTKRASGGRRYTRRRPQRR